MATSLVDTQQAASPCTATPASAGSTSASWRTTDLWTSAFKDEIKALFIQAVELEYQYSEDTMPRAVLGMNASMRKVCLRCITNRRATQFGTDVLFPNKDKAFPRMSERVDLKKDWNFFETRVLEHQSRGALSSDGPRP